MNKEINASTGYYIILGTALISGFSVFLNKYAMGFWGSSSVFATAKSAAVAILLTSLILAFKKIPELAGQSRRNWAYLLAIAFVGGSVPFLLFFKGLSMTDAGGAALIHKSLFVWVSLLALVFLKEKITAIQISALGILLCGVYLFVSPASFSFGYGEMLILAATLLWAIENVIAKSVLKDVSSLTVVWARMFFGSIFLTIFLLASGQGKGMFAIGSWEQAGWLLATAVLLLGYTVTYYAAVKRLPVSIAASVLVLAFPVTSFFESVVSNSGFGHFPFLPFAVMIFGAMLLTRFFEKTRYLVKKGMMLWKAY